jgi:hypothetical protein
MAHPPELRRFIGGKETRQLFALDMRIGRIIQIPEGGAPALRSDCHDGHLVCPIETCDSRSFTTVGGSKRHHFRHRIVGARAHGRESYYHQLGKALLGQAIRERYPSARVVVDKEALDGGQRPDVLVELPEGARFAFELQYSPLTVESWQARHYGYEADGVIDVWIFGHLPPHLRPSRYHREQRFAWAIEVTPLARALHASGAPVRFFSPDERTFATALIESGEPFLRAWDAAELSFESVDACEIRGEKFWTPTDDVEDAARVARAAEVQRAEADARRRKAEHVLRLADDARRERNRDRIAAWKKRKEAEAERAWQSDGEPRFLQLVGLAETPPIIARELRADRGIYEHPARWHAELYWCLLHGRVGSAFTFRQAARRFYKAQPKDTRGARIALAGYLFELRRRGYVTFASEGTWIEGDIVVIADLRHPPQPDWGYVRLLHRGEGLTAVAATGEVIAEIAASGSY